MPFPVYPHADQDPAQFLIQDPFGVRESILPILSVDREDGNLTGLGTAFCVDPFGGFLTAQHLFEDVDLTRPPEFDGIPVAMLGAGLVFGTVGLSWDLFAAVQSLYGFVDVAPPDPFAAVSSRSAGPTIIADVLRLTLDVRSERHLESIHPLPLRCNGRMPRIGDRVLAIGYPELGLVIGERMPERPQYVERMYGAIGTITGIHPNGLTSSRPWPTLEVEANWLSGMSGGPIFNEAGEIIGLVSSSLAPSGDQPGVGFGVWFGGFPVQRLLPFLDRNNPGFYRGFAAIRPNPWHLAGLHRDEAAAAAQAATLGPDYEVWFGSNRYGTDDFMQEMRISTGPDGRNLGDD